MTGRPETIGPAIDKIGPRMGATAETTEEGITAGIETLGIAGKVTLGIAGTEIGS